MTIPPIKIVMTGGWFRNGFYSHKIWTSSCGQLAAISLGIVLAISSGLVLDDEFWDLWPVPKESWRFVKYPDANYGAGIFTYKTGPFVDIFGVNVGYYSSTMVRFWDMFELFWPTCLSTVCGKFLWMPLVKGRFKHRSMLLWPWLKSHWLLFLYTSQLFDKWVPLKVWYPLQFKWIKSSFFLFTWR